MDTVLQDLVLAAPEVFLLTAACSVLLLSVFLPQADDGTVPRVTVFVLFIYLLLVWEGIPTEAGTAFAGSYRADLMGSALKLGAGLLTLLALLYGRSYLQTHSLGRGEYYVLTLSALLGISVLLAAGDFLSLYLGLELLSLSLYALVAMSRRPSAIEAGMKYFVLGALASGLLLYGISLLYGLSGTLQFPAVAAALQQQQGSPALALALVFIIAGIAFKLGAAPFHMWVPDVYQGAPLPVTLFVSSAPKLAAFGLIARLLHDAAAPAAAQWVPFLIPIAALSMLAGNLIAIAQSDLRRMFAYSTIAHVGFLLLGPIAGGPGGFAAAMFYALVYAFMSAAAFAVILTLCRPGMDAIRINQYAGLARTDPTAAALLAVLMFSLAGVPPFAGFWAKWFVLLEVVQAGHIPLAVLAVTSSVIGAYFYLRLVKLAFFDKPGLRSLTRQPNKLPRTVLNVHVLVIFALAILAHPLVKLCLTAFNAH